jgi:hypothetical protein
MKIELKPLGGGAWFLRYTLDSDGLPRIQLFTNWARAKAAVRKLLNDFAAPR